MKNLILTTVLSLTILSGLQAQETYYEKHVAFPADATVAEKIDMASRLVPTPQQLEWQRMELTESGEMVLKILPSLILPRWTANNG